MKPTEQSGPHRKRPSLDEKYLVPTATLGAAMARAPKIDYARLRADVDAHVDQDPALRVWPKP